MNTKIQTKKHKKGKIIVISLMILSLIMTGVFIYLLYLYLESRPLIDYPKYFLSTTEWTSGNVVITVDSENDKIGMYSFDGGVNYQESNKYEVTDNGQYTVIVKDINGRESNKIIVYVQNIDKYPPIISFENNTIIQVGSKFSLRSGVQVYDDASGLSSNYVVTPDSIDTSVVGEYVFKYTAFDKVGNYSEKERKVSVIDKNGTTYYRYRDGKNETYQCEPYSCECVVSDSAKLTLTCPSGYTFNDPDKCCKTCYKTCNKIVWGEWSDWTTTKVNPTATREVETKVE